MHAPPRTSTTTDLLALQQAATISKQHGGGVLDVSTERLRVTTKVSRCQ